MHAGATQTFITNLNASTRDVLAAQCLNKFYLHAILTLIENRDRHRLNDAARSNGEQNTKPSGYNWISMKEGGTEVDETSTQP